MTVEYTVMTNWRKPSSFCTQRWVWLDTFIRSLNCKILSYVIPKSSSVKSTISLFTHSLLREFMMYIWLKHFKRRASFLLTFLTKYLNLPTSYSQIQSLSVSSSTWTLLLQYIYIMMVMVEWPITSWLVSLLIQKNLNQEFISLHCYEHSTTYLVHPPLQLLLASYIPTLCVFFHCGYCPKGIFSALVVDLMKPRNRMLQWQLVQDAIYRDQVSFEVG